MRSILIALVFMVGACKTAPNASQAAGQSVEFVKEYCGANTLERTSEVEVVSGCWGKVTKPEGYAAFRADYSDGSVVYYRLGGQEPSLDGEKSVVVTDLDGSEYSLTVQFKQDGRREILLNVFGRLDRGHGFDMALAASK